MTTIWGDKPAKRTIDYGFNSMKKLWVKSRKVPIRVLSLPADGWRWERELEATYPNARFDFYGIERDPNIFTVTKRTANRLNRRDHHNSYYPISGDYKDWLINYHAARQEGRTSMQFDIVYLDFMGSWSTEKLELIDLTARYDVCSSNSWLRFTLSACRGWDSCWERWAATHPLQGYQVTDTRVGPVRDIAKWRLYGIPRIVTTCWAPLCTQIKPLHCGVYHSPSVVSPGHTSPQLSYLFKLKSTNVPIEILKKRRPN